MFVRDADSREQTGTSKGANMHICPDEIVAFIMVLPFVGGVIHWVRHKLKRTKCRNDATCVPKCEHSVVKDELYDPLDP
jgi:hypothetical protein